MKYNHCDCALVIGTEFPHVSAALQALLHVPHLRQYLANDFDSSKHCKSLLKCLVCAFLNLIESALKNVGTVGVADASFFGNKWRSLSLSLQEGEKQRDPHEVLFLFLTRMRADVLKEEEWNSTDAVHSSAVSKMFYTTILEDVSCSGCGNFRQKEYFLSISLENFNEDLSNCINSQICKETQRKCTYCHRLEAIVKPINVTLPSVLIIHSEKCSPKFCWKNNLTLLDESFEFLGCIVDDGHHPFYVNMCPDGKLRMFQDLQVSVISPGRFAISEFLVQAKLTLLYIRKIKTAAKLSQQSANPRKACLSKVVQGIKVIGFPNITMLDPEPMSKQKSTQTQVKMFCDASTQTEEKATPKKSYKTAIVSYESCKLDERFKFFTGVCVDDFEALFNLIGGDIAIRSLKLKYGDTTPTKTIHSNLTSRDRLFMLLLRLRRGYPGEEIGFLFGIDSSYAYRICYAMTQLVYRTFKSMEHIMFVSAKDQRKGQPKVMQPFKNLRVILDGMSLFLQAPSNFQQQGNTYSNYKKHNVLLFAIGISTHGATIFCSPGFEGATSDKESIVKSGLLDMLDKGDGVMTDRGYELTAEFQAKGCHFYKPPSLGDRNAFTAEEETLTKAIATARIYVEHAIADIKDWKILQGVLPLNMISQWSNIVYILAFMRNFNPNRIHNKRFSAKSPEEDECL